MARKIDIVGYYKKGEIIPVNSKGFETIDVDINELRVISLNRGLRIIGFSKKLMKVSLKSWKALRKELERKRVNDKSRGLRKRNNK